MMGYAIPNQVRENARIGLELMTVWGKGGMDIDRKTARILSNTAAISFPVVKRISEYFPKHVGDNLNNGNMHNNPPSDEFIAWMLWGGDDGWEWSRKVVRQRKELDVKRRMK